eukprot:CAMPEP_0114583518 /NCGR_PEP_ID=MMETSP0125-20121206/7217_1 /TAXON_ID=485358 ORGANISM="Aristerostoma sp., Strain ATCC 50986" /NCGR_SAMPLE_ID=MMETSP0125 /ASSEMBLY_ACC=CAM_ASM_000245 /LENGTH=49 /DNA_ID=CAMNT_0001776987 /DNA_START=961 /DNA_END=1110 /DNA_ORIENTATION=-
MKMGSYVPFTIFFAGIVLGLAEKVIMKYFHLGRFVEKKEDEEIEKKKSM